MLFHLSCTIDARMTYNDHRVHANNKITTIADAPARTKTIQSSTMR